MIERTLSRKVSGLAKQFPVITITGPRQAGKTTLAKMVFPDYDYANLEDPEEREFAIGDPRGFLRRFSGGLIIDKVQRNPLFLSYIQGIVDKDPRPGRFVLTGSQQLHMMEKVSQTLAGRTAIANLLPFTLAELSRHPHADPWDIAALPAKKKSPLSFSLEDILYQGFYPRIHDKKLDARDWLAGYYQTYVERDVRDIKNIGDLSTFENFVRLCAGRSGQLLNLSSLASDCGISHTTARNWISVLQAGFIIHLLPPHHENFSKRIVKSQKLYFLDPGLLCYLLRIKEPKDVLTHGMRGAIFKTFIVAEFYKAFCHIGERPPLFFWRDRTGHEIDLIVDDGKTLTPIEVKSGETMNNSFFDGLRFFTSLNKKVSKKGVLIYGGNQMYERNSFIVRPWWSVV